MERGAARAMERAVRKERARRHGPCRRGVTELMPAQNVFAAAWRPPASIRYPMLTDSPIFT